MEIDNYFIISINNKIIIFKNEEKEKQVRDEEILLNKFINLEYDPLLIKNKVFLDRSVVDYIDGKAQFNLEHRFCLNTFVIRHLAGGEDFFMRCNYRRNKK